MMKYSYLDSKNNNEYQSYFIVPDKIEYVITKSEPGVKGNTTSTAMKDAELESGLVIKVPMYIEQDEMVLVSSKDGKYVSRA